MLRLRFLSAMALLAAPTVTAQPWMYAGADCHFPAYSGERAADLPLGPVNAVAADANGNIYVSDPGNGMVMKIDAKGILSVIGHGPFVGYPYSLNPRAIAADPTGNVYVADRSVLRIDAWGINSVVADIPYANSIAVDDGGNLYVSVTYPGQIVYKVTPSGTRTLFAGSEGPAGFAGDDGPAAKALFGGVTALAADRSGNIYVADTANGRVRKIDPDGIIRTVAGNGLNGSSGDGGPATDATLSFPSAVALDGAGNLYIAETGSPRIRKVSGGVITTVAGTGRYGFSGDGGPAVEAALRLSETAYQPIGIAATPDGGLLIADRENYRVRKLLPDGNLTSVAGNGQFCFVGDGGPARLATLNAPRGVALDPAGNLYISERARIRKVDREGVITNIAGDGIRDRTPDGERVVNIAPDLALAADAGGNVFFAEGKSIRKIAPDGIIATPGIFEDPRAIALDGIGNLYVADGRAARVYRMAADGAIDTVAGNGNSGFSGDGGPALDAMLDYPCGVSVAADGSIYISDASNGGLKGGIIRKVTPEGTILTVAGTGQKGSSGDGGAALDATLNGPRDIIADGTGGFYFVDQMNYRIRRVTADGIINTVVRGSPSQGMSAWERMAYIPGSGMMFIADPEFNHVFAAFVTP